MSREPFTVDPFGISFDSKTAHLYIYIYIYICVCVCVCVCLHCYMHGLSRDEEISQLWLLLYLFFRFPFLRSIPQVARLGSNLRAH